MITIAKIKQATSEFVKVLRFGKNDVQTVLNVAPHGIDSKPNAKDTGIHATTANKNDSVFLGCVYSSEKTKEGETRVFATDGNGNEVFDILLKNDGTCIFNSGIDNVVKYLPLNTELQNYNLLIVAELAKIAAGLAGVGGAYTPGILSIDISGAKVDEVKI